jgi:hypothetical protein
LASARLTIKADEHLRMIPVVVLTTSDAFPDIRPSYEQRPARSPPSRWTLLPTCRPPRHKQQAAARDTDADRDAVAHRRHRLNGDDPTGRLRDGGGLGTRQAGD